MKMGDRVRTQLTENTSDDWTEEGRKERKFGVTGHIVDHSDAHGECFLVLHDDNSKAWYDPWELILLGS